MATDLSSIALKILLFQFFSTQPNTKTRHPALEQRKKMDALLLHKSMGKRRGYYAETCILFYNTNLSIDTLLLEATVSDGAAISP